MATFKQLKVAKGKMQLTNVGENFMDVLDNTREIRAFCTEMHGFSLQNKQILTIFNEYRVNFRRFAVALHVNDGSKITNPCCFSGEITKFVILV